ncbi:MAG: hypothetical protein JWN41_1000 [Thermoleophilia bacterium]|nr:hypothetical protein [Thermoleophilia bacterium]
MHPIQPHPEAFEFVADPFALATRTAQMLSSRATWIRRRVDSLEFLGVDRVRRRMSFDVVPLVPPVAVPGYAPIDLGKGVEARAFRDLVPLPLVAIRKGTLQAFDARDGAGAAVSVLTRQQNALLASIVLRALAQAAFDEHKIESDAPFRDDLLNELGRIPVQSPSQARASHDFIFRSDAGRTIAEFVALRRSLDLRRLAGTFVDSFVLQIAIPTTQAARQIIKISFEEQLGVTSSALVGKRSAPLDVRLDMPDLFGAGSHHVEVIAPTDTNVARWSLTADTGKYERSLISARVPSNKVHRRLRGRRERDGLNEGKILIRLVVDPGSLHISGLMVMMTTSGLLIAGAIGNAIWGLTPRADGSASVLLLVPAVAAGIIVRPNDHAVVRTLTRRVRLVVLASAACCVVAASSLVVQDQPGRTLDIWELCAGASGVLFSIMLCWTVAAMWRWRRGSSG